MNLLDVFRRAEACAEQEQAGKQCGSNEVDFSHAVFGGGRQMTIGRAATRCKAASEWQAVHALGLSIGMAIPLICPARSSASHRTRSATSAGCTHFEKSARGMDFRFVGVSIVPGKTTFAVIPLSLFSSATVRTRVVSADLNVTYAPSPACGSTAARLPIAMARPFPDFRRCGIAARKT